MNGPLAIMKVSMMQFEAIRFEIGCWIQFSSKIFNTKHDDFRIKNFSKQILLHSTTYPVTDDWHRKDFQHCLFISQTYFVSNMPIFSWFSENCIYITISIFMSVCQSVHASICSSFHSGSSDGSWVPLDF